ncbi:MULTISPECIES: LysR family transcriptional regulator [Limosilactobacillus]|uniref:LysR family transcriptional regulator n=1 Tax=Limosilactobacillus balticus TaxID=2759747 RepID=A0ABS8RHJ8_9LACO|nr:MULTISPECIES: LysR family transcriptional regulator [Limosilactobacillus]MBB1127750.1 LysR family transcriptional regulator [Limosilactobacillus balticus]MCD7136747.1 LysR family transcriptional regulator [Limosilactobacillus balticus]MCD7138659.1 LysR family transcriptional regulator [Limosilactobacillus balticus]MDE7040871.1 LysR family transcriptional regulator [Limosilactobacillus sp.]
MVDLELLTELVAFHKYGTLSATAEHLMVTQPTVTRGMKKLEQELGVSLFNREISNRILLNETGLLAAAEAKKLLQAENNFTEKILNFDRLSHKITISSIAPGPIRLIDAFKNQFTSHLELNHQLIKPENILTNLQTLKERLIFTDKEYNTDEVESMYIGIEYIGVGIDKFHPLAQHKSVSFKQLVGLIFLVVQDTGPWEKIIEEHIPAAKFLYQQDLSSMRELSQYSNFPFFYSNLTEETSATFERFSNGNHTKLPIVDKNNKIEFYGTYLKRDRQLIQPFLKHLIQIWPK